MTNRRVLSLAVALVVALAVATGCSDDSDPEAITTTTRAATSSSTAPTIAEGPASTGTPAGGCDTADQADLTTIETALQGADADHLGEAYTVEARGELRYLGANIYDADGTKTSSSNVWVFDGEIPFSLSGGARAASVFADGRDLTSEAGIRLSAGDQYGLAVQACVQGG